MRRPGAAVLLKEERGLPLPPGRYVEIKVRDQGIGIPLIISPRFLTPFFPPSKKAATWAWPRLTPSSKITTAT